MPVINLIINQDDINRCHQFANDVVDHTYARLTQDLQQRKERIFVGKVGEVVFWRYLQSQGKNPDVTTMFQIYEGQTNVDSSDFVTVGGETVDVKTAHQEFHTRILVPQDQFENLPKDYYVGVKINLQQRNAIIYGYTLRQNLLRNDIRNFGEGNARWYSLDSLDDIAYLVERIE